VRGVVLRGGSPSPRRRRPERLQRMRALDQRARGQRHARRPSRASSARTQRRSSASSSSPTGTAGGTGSLVSSVRPVKVTISRSLAARIASSSRWRSSALPSAAPGDALACQQVEAHAATPTGPGAVVEPEQRDHARRHHASGRELASVTAPGAPLGARGLVEARGQQQLHGRRLDGLRAVRPLLGQRVERVAPGATGEQLIRSVVDQLRHDVAEHVAPRPHRARAAHRAHRVEDARARLGESTQPLGLAALDRIDRQRALPERAPVAGQSPAEQQPLQPEAPGVLLVGGERVRSARSAAVDPPAHRALAHPAAQHVLRARVEPEPRATAGAASPGRAPPPRPRARPASSSTRSATSAAALAAPPRAVEPRAAAAAAAPPVAANAGLQQRRGARHVGREHQHVARPQRRVGVEQRQHLVAQHLAWRIGPWQACTRKVASSPRSRTGAWAPASSRSARSASSAVAGAPAAGDVTATSSGAASWRAHARSSSSCRSSPSRPSEARSGGADSARAGAATKACTSRPAAASPTSVSTCSAGVPGSASHDSRAGRPAGRPAARSAASARSACAAGCPGSPPTARARQSVACHPSSAPASQRRARAGSEDA
jgi:hypothetical protein